MPGPGAPAGRRRAHLPGRLRRVVGDAADREVRARTGTSATPIEALHSYDFIWRKPAGLRKGALVVLASYSGETEDTVAALRFAQRARRDDARHRQGRRLGDRARGGPRDRVRVGGDLRGADRGAAAARCRHERGHGGCLRQAEELADAVAAVPGSSARVAEGRRRLGRGARARVSLQPPPLRARRGPALPARLQGRAHGRDGEHPHRRHLDATPRSGATARPRRSSAARPTRSCSSAPTRRARCAERGLAFLREHGARTLVIDAADYAEVHPLLTPLVLNSLTQWFTVWSAVLRGITRPRRARVHGPARAGRGRAPLAVSTVACLGDCCLDVYVEPVARVLVGGSCLNVAVGLRRRGAASVYAGPVGEDDGGRTRARLPGRARAGRQPRAPRHGRPHGRDGHPARAEAASAASCARTTRSRRRTRRARPSGPGSPGRQGALLAHAGAARPPARARRVGRRRLLRLHHRPGARAPRRPRRRIRAGRGARRARSRRRRRVIWSRAERPAPS